MNNSRDTIFEAIRRNKAQPVSQPQHTVPISGRLEDETLFERFCIKVKASAATFSLTERLDQAPEAIANYLGSLDKSVYQPADHIYINHPKLAKLNWQHTHLRYFTTPTNYNSKICITLSALGIAETGTIVLQSAPKVSSASYFLADLLIVVISKSHILASQEDVWKKTTSDRSSIARTITLVTGPSRTGDIEQKLVIGAHGPRHEHLVIVND